MPRLLVIAKDFPAPGQPEGGIVVMRQTQAICKRGYEALVVRVAPYAPPLGRKWRAYGSLPPDYEVDGIRVRTLRAIFPPRMIGMEYLPMQVGSALRRLVASFRPDVIHAHCLLPSGQLSVGLNVPTVVTAHGSDAYDWAWRRPGLTRAAREGVVSATAVVAVSAFIRDRVLALANRPVEIIYNGADEDVFHPQDRHGARRELHIDDNRFVVAFAGAPPKLKGVFDLIAATATLQRLRPLLLLAGPDVETAAIRAAASARAVDVRLCGMLDHHQLARIVAAANAFCLPSYREGLPLVVCEAMLSGRPVVATAVGGIPEIVANGINGFLVPAGNPEALARALGTLGSEPSMAERMGEQAHVFARERLTWSCNATRHEVLYRSVISGNLSQAVSAF